MQLLREKLTVNIPTPKYASVSHVKKDFQHHPGS